MNGLPPVTAGKHIHGSAGSESSNCINLICPQWQATDLRSDLIQRVRQMATDRIRRTRGNERHPLEGMNNEELLRTLGLVLTDQHGNTGLTKAAVLLFGPDGMIASACPHLKTVCICRVYNLDSYDDCDVIAPHQFAGYL